MIKTINIIFFIMTFIYFLAGQLSYSKDQQEIDPSNKFDLVEYLNSQKLNVTNFNFDFDGLQSWSVRKKN